MPSVLAPPPQLNYDLEGFWDGLNDRLRFSPFDLSDQDAAAYVRGVHEGQAAREADGCCEWCGSGPTCSICMRGQR